jgi:hypothetical protein
MAYCSQTLTGLTTDCNNNVGGIRIAYIANYVEDAFTVSGGAISAIDSAITWYEYNFRKETGNFTSTLNVDAANGVNYVSSEINLVFSRMETLKRIEMKALSLGDLMVIVKDSNDKYWAFGVEEPVTASAGTGETGTARGDGNKYSITLSDIQASFPMELTADAITTLKAHINS